MAIQGFQIPFMLIILFGSHLSSSIWVSLSPFLQAGKLRLRGIHWLEVKELAADKAKSQRQVC